MHSLKCRMNDTCVREFLYDNELGLYFSSSAGGTLNDSADTVFVEVTRSNFIRILLLCSYDLYKDDQVERANKFYSTALQLALDYDERIPGSFISCANEARNEALARAVRGR